jgi:thioredoxin 1
MKAVTDASFSSEVLRADKPVLVDFWADWCQPCRKVAPLLEELSRELGDEVEIVKVDIDANPEVTRAYQVMSVPTLTVFRGGRPVNTLVGARPGRPVTARRISFALRLCSVMRLTGGPASRVIVPGRGLVLWLAA